MNITLNSTIVRTHPAYASPLRVGVLAHLAAFATPTERTEGEITYKPFCFVVSPSALAATLTSTRSQIENAIVDLAKHQLITVDKSFGARGYWYVDMSQSCEILSSGVSSPIPKVVPIRIVMAYWDKCYEEKNGYKYIRSNSDYWREKADWNQLYAMLEDDLKATINKYFNDIRFKQWDYAFKVFFKSAAKLSSTQRTEIWNYR